MLIHSCFSNVYNGSYKDQKPQLDEILASEMVAAMLSAPEIGRLYTKAQALKSARPLADYLREAELTESTLAERYDVPADRIADWSADGMNEVDKQMLTYAVLVDYIYRWRHHICALCGDEFFDHDPNADLCPACYQDLLKEHLAMLK